MSLCRIFELAGRLTALKLTAFKRSTIISPSCLNPDGPDLRIFPICNMKRFIAELLAVLMNMHNLVNRIIGGIGVQTINNGASHEKHPLPPLIPRPPLSPGLGRQFGITLKAERQPQSWRQSRS
ncbi:MAG: hypothetical protein LBC85_03775 [Fibromonadaceae bacterium]|nr:hypothetical protein [Fibromonadaceae bacterium]